jgi:hypothetical protein
MPLTGDIRIANVVEGSRCSIKCRSLLSKMFHCQQLDIETSEMTSIEALYAGKAAVTSQGSIAIDLLRGDAKLLSQNGDIFLKGIDGSFHTAAENGRIELQVNQLKDSSSSIAKAKQGNVLAKIDPKVSCLVWA